MLFYCVSHKAPDFKPTVAYTRVAPTSEGKQSQLIVTDDQYGLSFHGSVLSEYVQLFGLADHLKDSPSDDLYIFQYRKFISLREGLLRSTNIPYAFASHADAAEKLFPSVQEIASLDGYALMGPSIEIRSMALNYAVSHHVADFSAFVISLSTVTGFNESRCKRFINCTTLIPSPSLGVHKPYLFMKHMDILKATWSHFASHFFVEREGYQRRVGGFLLERLHSFLISEEVNSGHLKGRAGNLIVISESPIIRLST